MWPIAKVGGGTCQSSSSGAGVLSYTPQIQPTIKRLSFFFSEFRDPENPGFSAVSVEGWRERRVRIAFL